jgi:multiple sugar transport system substrate-binding protein
MIERRLEEMNLRKSSRRKLNGRVTKPLGGPARAVKVFAVVGAAAIALAACGSSSKPTSSKAPSSSSTTPSSTTRSSSKKVTLTFWSWVPGIATQVALFNKTHPDINVVLTKTAGSTATYAKFFTAIKAADTPDVGQIEFDVLPDFVRTGGILDLAKYGANADAGKFSPSAWSEVDFGGGTWAIPQATGPTGLAYNAKLFKKYGLAVPTTWAQFASEAKSLHAAHPGVYLTNFNLSTSWLGMFAWQAGATWFKPQGSEWKLGFTSAASEKAANYWQTLISDHAVLPSTEFTPAWYKQLDTGEVLTWPTAQWGQAIMEDDITTTAGDWKVAPMPQWTAGAHAYGQWGGSTTAVFKTTKHPRAALTFALWMNTNAQAVQAGVLAGFGWPAATSGLTAPALHSKPSYFSNQDTFSLFNTAQKDTLSDWNFGPDFSTVRSQGDDLYKGLTDGSLTLTQWLKQLQSEQLSTLKGLGITAVG